MVPLILAAGKTTGSDMDPVIGAAILGGVQLISSLGQALFGSSQAEQASIQNAIVNEGKAKQDALQRQQAAGAQSLGGLIEAYRASLMR